MKIKTYRKLSILFGMCEFAFILGITTLCLQLAFKCIDTMPILSILLMPFIVVPFVCAPLEMLFIRMIFGKKHAREWCWG